MSGALSAATGLRAAALAGAPAVKAAVEGDYANALRAVRGASPPGDVLAHAQAAAALILAAEALAETAATLARQARAGLAEAMSTGLTSFRTEGHTVVLCQPAPKPVVTNPALLPSDFLTVPDPPKPKPDLALIARAVADGCIPPGVALSNAAPYVQMKARKA